MKTLALVPARAGSKGISGKNLRSFHGKPLFAWAVEVGVATCEAVFVTTDDPEIGLQAIRFGARVIGRPKELAEDETPMLPVVRHAVGTLEPHMAPEVVVLLQPTQPLRTAEHVRQGLAMLTDEWDSVVSVTQIPEHYCPDFAMRIDHGRLEQFLAAQLPTRRQDCRPAYSRDGTFYITRREVIEAGSLYGGDCRAMVIPDGESCNIDTEDDWQRAERMKAVA